MRRLLVLLVAMTAWVASVAQVEMFGPLSGDRTDDILCFQFVMKPADFSLRGPVKLSYYAEGWMYEETHLTSDMSRFLQHHPMEQYYEVKFDENGSITYLSYIFLTTYKKKETVLFKERNYEYDSQGRLSKCVSMFKPMAGSWKEGWEGISDDYLPDLQTTAHYIYGTDGRLSKIEIFDDFTGVLRYCADFSYPSGSQAIADVVSYNEKGTKQTSRVQYSSTATIGSDSIRTVTRTDKIIVRSPGENAYNAQWREGFVYTTETDREGRPLRNVHTNDSGQYRYSQQWTYDADGDLADYRWSRKTPNGAERRNGFLYSANSHGDTVLKKEIYGKNSTVMEYEYDDHDNWTYRHDRTSDGTTTQGNETHYTQENWITRVIEYYDGDKAEETGD
ncbi:MAG: hypothetical protein J5732_08850 [Bacteroidaceae bacterium]|nr:hypothetical protein [Bacteroidaceae bacterium]